MAFKFGGGCGCCCSIRNDNFNPINGTEYIPATGFYTYTTGTWEILPTGTATNYYLRSKTNNNTLSFQNSNKSLDLDVNILFSGIQLNDEFKLNYDGKYLDAKVITPIPSYWMTQLVTTNTTGILITNSLNTGDDSLVVVDTVNDIKNITLRFYNDDVTEASGLACSELYYTPAITGLKQNTSLSVGSKTFSFELIQGTGHILIDSMHFSKRSIAKCPCTNCSCDTLNCGTSHTFFLNITGASDKKLTYWSFKDNDPISVCQGINSSYNTAIATFVDAHGGDSSLCGTYCPCGQCAAIPDETPSLEDFFASCEIVLQNDPTDCGCLAQSGLAFGDITYPTRDEPCCAEIKTYNCNYGCPTDGLYELYQVPGTCEYRTVVLEEVCADATYNVVDYEAVLDDPCISYNMVESSLNLITGNTYSYQYSATLDFTPNSCKDATGVLLGSLNTTFVDFGTNTISWYSGSKCNITTFVSGIPATGCYTVAQQSTMALSSWETCINIGIGNPYEAITKPAPCSQVANGAATGCFTIDLY